APKGTDVGSHRSFVASWEWYRPWPRSGETLDPPGRENTVPAGRRRSRLASRRRAPRAGQRPPPQPGAVGEHRVDHLVGLGAGPGADRVQDGTARPDGPDARGQQAALQRHQAGDLLGVVAPARLR